MKKLIIGSLGLITATVPLVAVVSCSNKKTQSVSFLKEEKIDESKLVKVELTSAQEKLFEKYMDQQYIYRGLSFEEFLKHDDIKEENNVLEGHMPTTELYKYNGQFVVKQILHSVTEEFYKIQMKLMHAEKEAVEEMVPSASSFAKYGLELGEVDENADPEKIIEGFEKHGFPKYADLIRQKYLFSKFSPATAFDEKNGHDLINYKLIDPKDGLNKVTYLTFNGSSIRVNLQDAKNWFKKEIDIYLEKIKSLNPHPEQMNNDIHEKMSQTLVRTLSEDYPVDEFNNTILEAITTYKPAEEAK